MGQLAVMQVSQGVIVCCDENLFALEHGERMRCDLGDRCPVGEVLIGEMLRITPLDPATHPARIDHENLARPGDRRAALLRIGDCPDDEALDLRGQTRPADWADQTPSVFPRSRVFSIASSLSALLVRVSSCSSSTLSRVALRSSGTSLESVERNAPSLARSRITRMSRRVSGKASM